ncbi:MAG: hypothetical protein AB1483_00035 [Candidatus Zixiibacteriota bacterium]
MIIDLESGLRKRFTALYKKYRVISLLTGACDNAEQDVIDRQFDTLSNLSRNEIRRHMERLTDLVRNLSDHYGWKGTSNDIEMYLNETKDKKSLILWAKKTHLQRLFSRYDNAMPIFDRLPPHARIGVDIHNAFERKGKAHYFIVEAALYEDMTALWNHTSELYESCDEQTASAEEAKLLLSLMRATARSAFCLIEGYINGLGWDIALSQKLSKKYLTIVTEWDVDRQCAVRKSLRDKLLLYPKIAMGKEHPLFDENSCIDMKELLQFEKKLRHSLIHPTPMPQLEGESSIFLRESVFLSPSDFSMIGDLCDVVVRLISKINEALDGLYGDAALWLKVRNPEGCFPTDTFE